MKKILFVALAMFIYSMAYSQDEEIPEKVDNAFKLKYPKAKNVYWYSEDNNYKIEFDVLVNTYTAIYSKDGTWVETAKVISDTDVPGKVISAINKKYPECEISYAEYVENGKGEKYYRINSYTEEADYIINVTGEGTILSADKKASTYDPNEG